MISMFAGCLANHDHTQSLLLILGNLRTDHLSKSFSPIGKWAYVFKDPNMKSHMKRISMTNQIEDSDIIEDPVMKQFVERLDVDKIPPTVHDNSTHVIHYYNDTIVDMEEKSFEK